MSPEQIRIIPDNGTVRELNIPKEISELLEKFVASPYKTDANKKYMIKKLAKASPCCICHDGIPLVKVALLGLNGIARSV